MVVAGDDGDVFGTAQLVLAEGAHEADGHQIVRDEHRVGLLLEDVESAAISGFDAEVAMARQRRHEGPSGVPQRFLVSGEPLPCAADTGKAIDDANPLIAEPHQMHDRFVSGVPIVENDRIKRQSPADAHHERDRNLRRPQLRRQLRIEPPGRLGQQNAIDAFGEEDVEIEPFLLRIVVAVREQQRVAGLVRFVFGAAHDLRPEGVRDIGNDHPDHVRLLLGETPGEQVGTVAQVFNRLADARLQRPADVGRVVDDRGHRRDRYARTLRDVVDVGHRNSEFGILNLDFNSKFQIPNSKFDGAV